jgi:hypothetical protein
VASSSPTTSTPAQPSPTSPSALPGSNLPFKKKKKAANRRKKAANRKPKVHVPKQVVKHAARPRAHATAAGSQEAGTVVKKAVAGSHAQQRLDAVDLALEEVRVNLRRLNGRRRHA